MSANSEMPEKVDVLVSEKPNGNHIDEPHWQHDSRNPLNWTIARKWTTTILVSIFTFNTLMCSTMVAPALSQITKDLNIKSDAETQLVLSIYVLSYIIGFFVWAPLSELYGRLIILQVASTWFFVWNLVCGFASSEGIMIAGRLLSGAGDAAALAIAPGIISDVWRPEQRGRSLVVLSIVPLLGPTVGPIIAAVLTQHGASSWRWAFWATAAFDAVLQVLALLFLRETYAPTILARLSRQRERSKETTEISTLSLTVSNENKPNHFRILCLSMKRPFHLLFTQPILPILAIYSGVAFGILYIILSTYTNLFVDVYHQSLTASSLQYLSLGVGLTAGSQICGPVIDWLYKRNVRRLEERDEQGNEKRPEPEIRLVPLIPSILLITSGLLIFGLTAQHRTHWIFPDIGIAIFSAGNQAMTQMTTAYVVDVFTPNETYATRSHAPPGVTSDAEASQQVSQPQSTLLKSYSASAMASVWSLKATGGFAFPLFGKTMQRRLGWGWSGVTLALISLGCGLAVSLSLTFYGKKMRAIGERKRSEN